jgi:molybdopterin synthase catalytic subunit
MATPVTIRIQSADFDIAAEIAALTKGNADIGAVVTFSGICRGGTGEDAIAAMTLEHYPGMAEAEIGRHVTEAVARWPLDGVTVIHRHGRVVRAITSCWCWLRRSIARRRFRRRNS